MRAFWLLVRLRLVEVGRSALTAFWFLGMPLVLLLVVGVVFMNGHPFERRHVAVVAPAAPPIALLGLPELRLQAEPSEAAALGRLRSRMVSAILISQSGRGFRLVVGPLDQLLGRGLKDTLGGDVTLEVAPVPRWGYVHYLFPGLLTLTIVLGGLFGMGYHMARYRHNLFLKKLATTPLSRATFVAAQIASRSAWVFVQAALMVGVARLVFRLPLSGIAALWLTALGLLGLLTFMGVGFVLSALIRTEDALLDVISALVLPLIFLSEVFFSVDELPGPLPHLAAALPSTQLVRLCRAVLLCGEVRPGALLGGMAVVAAWMVAAYAASLLTFRWYD